MPNVKIPTISLPGFSLTPRVSGEEATEEDIRRIYGDKVSIIRAPTAGEKARIRPIASAETVRRQQEAAEEISGAGRVRIPFEAEKTFRVPGPPDPLKTFITDIATRTPELLVSIPTAMVNFFRIYP